MLSNMPSYKFYKFSSGHTVFFPPFAYCFVVYSWQPFFMHTTCLPHHDRWLVKYFSRILAFAGALLCSPVYTYVQEILPSDVETFEEYIHLSPNPRPGKSYCLERYEKILHSTCGFDRVGVSPVCLLRAAVRSRSRRSNVPMRRRILPTVFATHVGLS
jgi:hypothetical protein